MDWPTAWMIFAISLVGFVVLLLAGVERGPGFVLAFGIIALLRAGFDNTPR